jgi:uncharacterized membrane protein YbhN (UPF0104 family)
MAAPETDPRDRSSPKRGWMQRIASVPTPVIFAISILVALLLLWRQGSMGDVIDAARRADAWIVVAALALYLLGLALLCLRWHLLVRMINGKSSLPHASEAFLTSVVINYAAPVGLAVPTRAALTKRALGLTAAETGAVALWEVALDVIVLAMGSVVWLGFSRGDLGGLSTPSNGELLAIAVFVAVGIAALVLAVLILRRKSQWWFRFRYLAKHTALYPRRRPRDASYAVAVSVIYWIGQGVVLWLLLAAMTNDAGAMLALGLVSLPVLVGMLSPVPGGAGIREALMLAVARVHNADAGAVLLAAITYRIALFAAIPVLYLVVRFWLRHNRSAGNGTVTVSSAATGGGAWTPTTAEDAPQER